MYAVIGPDYEVYYNGRSSVAAVMTAVEAAINDFDFRVSNPISNQMMMFSQTLDIDVSDVFICGSGSYEVTLEDGYISNPDVASVSLSGTTLSINTNSVNAVAEITVTGTAYDNTVRTNTFSIIVNDPNAASYSDDFETGSFSSDWSFSGYGDPWTIDSDSKDGYFAKSGATNNYLQSAIYLVEDFTETSSITFKYKTSTQAGDVLKLKIDGTTIASYDGTNDWTEVTYLVGDAGSHEIKWEYAKDNAGASGEDCVWIDDVHFAGLPGVGIDGSTISAISFDLAQNYPNPFNPTTSISYSLTNDSKVNLVVYNSNGDLVSTLVNGSIEQGLHSATFDASKLNSGIYYYSLTVNDIMKTKKMVLVK